VGVRLFVGRPRLRLAVLRTGRGGARARARPHSRLLYEPRPTPTQPPPCAELRPFPMDALELGSAPPQPLALIGRLIAARSESALRNSSVCCNPIFQQLTSLIRREASVPCLYRC